MHEVDYKIYGDDMQYVEVELDPMEAAVAEAGGMMYMEDGIEMETIFGDGSQQGSGFLGSLMSAGKRLISGEGLFITAFQNRGAGKKRVAFGAPYPGKIIPVHLSEVGGELLAQKHAFLPGCSEGRVLSWNGCKATDLSSCTPAARFTSATWGPARFCGSIPVASWRFSRAWITTFNTSATSSRRCLAVKVCSLRRCGGRAGSGCNRCRSAAWPTVSSPRRPGPAVKRAKKVPSSVGWAG